MRPFKMRHFRWHLRIIVMWAIEVFALILLILLLPDISFDNLLSAFLTIMIFGVVNAWIRPIIVATPLSPTLVIFGLVTLASNGLMIWLVGEFMPGLTLSGLWTPIIITSTMSLINITFSDILAIDDDDSYYEHLVYEIVNLTEKPKKSAIPGVLFIEIDGLSEPILRMMLVVLRLRQQSTNQPPLYQFLPLPYKSGRMPLMIMEPGILRWLT